MRLQEETNPETNNGMRSKRVKEIEVDHASANKNLIELCVTHVMCYTRHV